MHSCMNIKEKTMKLLFIRVRRNDENAGLEKVLCNLQSHVFVLKWPISAVCLHSHVKEQTRVTGHNTSQT